MIEEFGKSFINQIMNQRSKTTIIPESPWQQYQTLLQQASPSDSVPEQVPDVCTTNIATALKL
jgi:hypothetical protein